MGHIPWSRIQGPAAELSDAALACSKPRSRLTAAFVGVSGIAHQAATLECMLHAVCRAHSNSCYLALVVRSGQAAQAAMYVAQVNFDCSCMWVRDAGPLKDALSLTPVYLRAKGNHLDFKARCHLLEGTTGSLLWQVLPAASAACGRPGLCGHAITFQ